jgi:tRNA A37 threonylcarbamoyladenosine synthetase subunit TsaC/SUA5/YrdC
MNRQIIQTLQTGGTVLIATDTVYGLAALPSCENAAAKIYSLKERPPLGAASSLRRAGVVHVMDSL